MTCSSEAMHEEARKFQVQREEEAVANENKVRLYQKHVVPPLEAKVRELRQWVAASIGQFHYAQWLLTQPVHERSQQIDEFVKKLEAAIK